MVRRSGRQVKETVQGKQYHAEMEAKKTKSKTHRNKMNVSRELKGHAPLSVIEEPSLKYGMDQLATDFGSKVTIKGGKNHRKSRRSRHLSR